MNSWDPLGIVGPRPSLRSLERRQAERRGRPNCIIQGCLLSRSAPHRISGWPEFSDFLEAVLDRGLCTYRDGFCTYRGGLCTYRGRLCAYRGRLCAYRGGIPSRNSSLRPSLSWPELFSGLARPDFLARFILFARPGPAPPDTCLRHA